MNKLYKDSQKHEKDLYWIIKKDEIVYHVRERMLLLSGEVNKNIIPIIIKNDF